MDTDATQVVEDQQVDDVVAGEPAEDGRTRCAWVRGRPEHYLYHDAEWGRLPDVETPVFEHVLMTCFERGTRLVDVLDQRNEIYAAFAEWDFEQVAEMSDADLDTMAQRGGVFEDRGRLGWIRDVAGSCVEIKKEFKGLREYFLAMPALLPEEQIADVVARFAGFEKNDAARLIQNVGCVGGAIQQWSHDRDCWIY